MCVGTLRLAAAAKISKVASGVVLSPFFASPVGTEHNEGQVT